MRRAWTTALIAVCALGVACSDDPVTPGTPSTRDASSSGPDAAEDVDATAPRDAAESPDADGVDAGSVDGSSPDAGEVRACEARTVECQDESIQELGLFRQPNAALVTTTATTGGFLSAIDTTGGGLSPSRSYVYLKFGGTGLDRVDIGDEAAFTSTNWDISMRRFVVRLNSGVSGPSCVGALRTPLGTSFDEVSTIPAGDLRVEEYMTPSPACALINDGSGLPGSPGVALQSFWEYPGCVKMTGHVYVIVLADGRAVKLQVLSYYSLANQQLCDTESRITTPSGAGAMRIKWAFL